MTTSYTDVFGGSTVQPGDVQFRAVALSASIVTVWPAFATTGNQLARIMQVTPSAGSLSIELPDARLTSAGMDVTFDNPGAYSFSVLDAVGNVVATVAAGAVKYFYLSDSSTAAGTWRVILFGAGSAAPDAAQLAGFGLKAIGATLNQATQTTTTSINTTLTSADRAQLYVNTGGSITVTLPLTSAVGTDWFVEFRNQGTGTMTIAPVGGEMIDASATIVLQVNESCAVHAGTGSWYTVGRGRNQQFNFTQLSKTVTGGTTTLTLTEAANIVQTYSGVLLSNEILVLPAVVQVYYIANNTTGGYSFTIKTPNVGSTLVLPTGQSAVVFSDGTNVINASTSVAGITSLLLTAGSAASPSLALANTNNGFFAPTGASVGVSAGGTEVVRWIGAQELAVNGTALLPAYGFTLSPSTGVYSPAANQWAVTTNGVQRLLIDASGNVTLNVALPVASGGTGISSFGTGIATFLGTPSSANLAAAVTDETGSGALVFATSPTLVTPALGTPASGVATNLSGTASGLTAGNVTTNANLTGDVTSVGNATTLQNAPVIAKVLTGYVSGAGTVAATDSILQAIQKLNGNNATNANLTGPITSVGNATSVASQTGTGTTFVMQASPTLTTPVLGVATATSVNKVALTAPATSSTLTIADGKTLTASNSLTLAGTDATTQTFPPVNASIGYLNIPLVPAIVNTTLTKAAHAGGGLKHPSSDTTARNFTIDSNANQSWQDGTTLTIWNQNAAGVVTVIVTADTQRLAGAGTTGNRTLAANGIATWLWDTATTTWICSGAGLT